MKRLIVLSAMVLATTLSVTSCGNKDKETEVQVEGEPATTVQPEDTVTVPETEAPATVAPDSLTEKK